MATVAVIDYGSGNLRSAEKALQRAARDSSIAKEILVTNDPQVVAKAERIVIPGVGAFGDCMDGLRSIDGMIPALEDAVLKRGVPMLGICVGMQLLATVGREFGDHEGLGWIEGEVVKLTPLPPPSAAPFPTREEGFINLKIPHMGWNELVVVRPHVLLEGIGEQPHAYFVHSYEFHLRNPADLLAATDYGGPVTAMVGRDNIAGTQFHPEKSQAVGLRLLSNFLRWNP